MPIPRATRELKLTVRTWAIVLFIALWMLAWAGTAYFLVGSRTPTWGYGTVPPVPGDSYYTAGPPPPQAPVPQQVPLPEAPGQEGQ